MEITPQIAVFLDNRSCKLIESARFQCRAKVSIEHLYFATKLPVSNANIALHGD